MQKLKYRITSLAPILIAETKGENNFVTTSDFIPGNSVLGMFAGKYINLKSLNTNSAHDDDMDFKDFFLSDKLNFTNAYIIYENDRSEIINTFPIPFSVQHDKDNDMKVFDLLFQDDQVKEEKIKTKAFNEYGKIDGEIINYQSVKKSLNFHHERDSKTGSSKKGLIFNYESLNSKQVFEGNIIGEKEILNKFRLNFAASFEARIGRSRNVQYGKVKFEFIGSPEDFESDIPNHVIENLENVTLTFLSDVIFFNENGLSTTDETVLINYLRNEIESISIEEQKYFVKDNTIESYISLWKLKRPSEVSFKAGSCFKLTGIADGDKNKLKALQRKGIGERRNEGYGRIVFNYQKNELSTAKNLAEQEVILQKPLFPIPDITREKMKVIVQDIIIRQAKYNGINDEVTFVNNNKKDDRIYLSKSLVSRVESFVKGSEDKSKFNEKLSMLRSTAKEKLEGCRMGDKNLFDWLVMNGFDVNNIVNNRNLSELNKILQDISYNIWDDIDFNNKIYKAYFLSFFASLRKSLKRIGG